MRLGLPGIGLGAMRFGGGYQAPEPVADSSSSVEATGVSGQIRFTFSTAPETYGAPILDMAWTDDNADDPATANSLAVDSGDTFPLVRDYNGLTDDVEITNVYTAVKTAGGWSDWSEDIGPVTPTGTFDPSSLGSTVLRGWWDASDESSITDSGGAVSQINDKSGNANHATATGGDQPATGSNTLNSLNVLTFSDDQLTLPDLGISGTDPVTVYMVARTGDTNENGLINIGSDGAGTRLSLTAKGASQNATVSCGGFDSAHETALSMGSSWGIVGFVFNGTAMDDVTVFLNGATEVSTETNAISITGTDNRLGNALSLFVKLVGDIAEVVVMKGEDAGDRADMVDYLYSKWGFSY